MKAPAFSGATSDQVTVYEFERDWMSYKAAVNYSVDEALRELKVVIQPPARTAVQKMETEEAIFAYLRTHYGNPVLLLSAREEEVRGWSDCKGSDQVRREWLIHAKNRLESTISLCKEHKIEKYLHYSSVAGLIQTKMPVDMTREFRKKLVKHLSPAGVLDKELVLGLLIDFMEEKILDCTLGVNLEIVNFLGVENLRTRSRMVAASGLGASVVVEAASGEILRHTTSGRAPPTLAAASTAAVAQRNRPVVMYRAPGSVFYAVVNTPSCSIVRTILKPRLGTGFTWQKTNSPVSGALPWGRSLREPSKIGGQTTIDTAKPHLYAKRDFAQISPDRSSCMSPCALLMPLRIKRLSQTLSSHWTPMRCRRIFPPLV
jgi:hypothetical protein